MPFTLIKGKFFVTGYQPDGDSLRFKANKLSNWNKLEGRKVKLTKNLAQLRFEAIDALETHYKGWHQPKKLGKAAADYLLKQAGFDDVKWGSSGIKVSSVKKDGMPGFVYSRMTEKYARPVCFVFAGNTPKKDGSEQFLSVSELKKSLNYKLLAAGLAYPIYYDSLFSDFRNSMTVAVKKARKDGKGVWIGDKTGGVLVSNRKAVEEKYHFFPKLFRRIVEFTSKKSTFSISGFLGYDALKKEKVEILSKGHSTHFDNLIKMQGNKVGLKYKSEDLMFTMTK